MATEPPDVLFTLPLPGGRVARVPLAVLSRYVDPTAVSHHGPGEEAATADVSAHGMTLDPSTGASVWHTEWELGHCDYTDESGYPQSGYAWHRHPLGTEYTEIFQK
jgi:hypothetical protein